MGSRARYDLTALGLGVAMGLSALLSPHTRWLLLYGGNGSPIAALLPTFLAACASAWCTARIFQVPIARLTRWRGALLAVGLTTFGGVLFVPVWALVGQLGNGIGTSDFLEPEEFPMLAVVAGLHSLPFAPVGWLGTLALRAAARGSGH